MLTQHFIDPESAQKCAEHKPICQFQAGSQRISFDYKDLVEEKNSTSRMP